MRGAALDAGLGGARVAPADSRVEIRLADREDAVRVVLRQLADRGIGPGLVLVVGDDLGRHDGAVGPERGLLPPDVPRLTAVCVGPEPPAVPSGVLHLGGGPRTVRAILREQVTRRRRLRVPSVDEDPSWVLVDASADPTRRRVVDTLFTVSDGELATRGAPEDTADDTARLVLADGVYTGQGVGTTAPPGAVVAGPASATHRPRSAGARPPRGPASP